MASTLFVLALAAPPALAADGEWTPYPNAPAPPHTPRHRHGHAMILDAANQRLVVFGGFRSLVDVPLGDTWTAPIGTVPPFDSLAIAPGPSPRYGSGAVYDPVRQRMLVFDGVIGQSGFDVWALSLGGSPAWSGVATTGAPASRRQGCAAVYDPVRDRVLVFGGHNGTSFTNEVLVFTAGAPSSITTLPFSGTPPSPRNYAAAIYDPVRDRMIVFGGNTGVALQDVHALDLSVNPPAWSALAPSGPPPGPRLSAGVLYDAAADRMVVVGGGQIGTYYGDAWALSLSDAPSWTQLSAGGGPTPRHSVGTVYDAPRNRLLLYGGESLGNSRDDLWALSLTGPAVWTRLGGTETLPSAPPPDRHGAAFALDASRQRVLMFGGRGSLGDAALGRLYQLRVDGFPSWERPVASGTAAGDLQGVSMEFDASGDRMLVFGGYRSEGGGWRNDLIQLALGNPLSWSSLAPLGAPPTPRNYHSAVVDPLRNRLIVFGGNAAGTPLNDLWWLDLALLEWHPVTGLAVAPAPRLSHRAAHDPGGDRMLVFGGLGVSGEFGDLWSLDLATLTWSPLPAAGGPGPRHSHSMAYDPLRQRMLVYGGWNGGASTSDLWALQLAPLPAWLPLDEGTPPPARHGHGAVYDALGDRLVVFGGYSSFAASSLADTWQFRPSDAPTPAAISLARAEAEPGRVRLSWYGAASVGRSATVERSAGDGEWRAVGDARFDGAGTLEFVDETAGPGRWAYRLVLADAGGLARTPAAWVEVPPGFAFALRGFVPNPASGPAWVSFSLPAPGPATVEVVDVSGRRVARRVFDGLAPGAHLARLTEPDLAPGVYLLRLVFGGRERVTRGAVIR